MKGVEEMDGRAIFGLLTLIVVCGMCAAAYILYGNIQVVGDNVFKAIISKIEKGDI